VEAALPPALGLLALLLIPAAKALLLILALVLTTEPHSGRQGAAADPGAGADY
jgi:hypothetical protein